MASDEEIRLLRESSVWIPYDLPPSLVPRLWGVGEAYQQQGLKDKAIEAYMAYRPEPHTAVHGDFSRYTLRLRASSGSDKPPAGFDPRLSSIEFSFKVECLSDFDCAAATPCPAATASTPTIDYLAKDYTGFRRLMLDRLNLLAPGWSERSAADLGVALVELIAYAADNLSYRQDAIANEAYLATAHNRISVRRHARLVDYVVHDGCNARAWVHIAVAIDQALPKGTPMLTRTRTGGVRPCAIRCNYCRERSKRSDRTPPVHVSRHGGRRARCTSATTVDAGLAVVDLQRVVVGGDQQRPPEVHRVVERQPGPALGGRRNIFIDRH